MTKTSNKLKIEGNFLTLIKGIYEKPSVNILNGERQKDIPLRSGTRQGGRLLPLLFNSLLEVLTSRKRDKSHPYWKRSSKTICR